MGKEQIQNEIYKANREVNNLKNSKIKYQNMNSKINEALKQLNNAKTYMSQAKADFDKNYYSDTAKKQSEKFQEVVDSINEIYNELNNNILPASKRKITSIDSNIYNKTNDIEQLKKELNSL